jgi:prophage regulatory protein
MTMPQLILDKPALRQLGIGYSPQHLLRLERAGKFPQRVQLSPNRVGWLATEIEAWIEQRAAARAPGEAA